VPKGETMNTESSLPTSTKKKGVVTAIEVIECLLILSAVSCYITFGLTLEEGEVANALVMAECMLYFVLLQIPILFLGWVVGEGGWRSVTLFFVQLGFASYLRIQYSWYYWDYWWSQFFLGLMILSVLLSLGFLCVWVGSTRSSSLSGE
jgi:hypothetical protein